MPKPDDSVTIPIPLARLHPVETRRIIAKTLEFLGEDGLLEGGINVKESCQEISINSGSTEINFYSRGKETIVQVSVSDNDPKKEYLPAFYESLRKTYHA